MKWILSIIAFVTLFLFCFFQLGIINLLEKGLQASIKHEMQIKLKNIPFHKLEKVTLPYTGQIKDEFYHNGDMYDVHSYKIAKNKITYFCLKDKDEKKLKKEIALLKRLYHKEDQNNKSGKNHIKIKLSDFITSTKQNLVLSSSLNQIKIHYLEKSTSSYIQSESHPPEV